MKMKTQLIRNLGHSRSNAKVYLYECLHLRKKRCQISNLMMYLKHLEKQEYIKFQISRQKVIVKIRTEINEMEIKIIQRINKKEVGSSLKR
jgi:hypothetical protein